MDSQQPDEDKDEIDANEDNEDLQQQQPSSSTTTSTTTGSTATATATSSVGAGAGPTVFICSHPGCGQTFTLLRNKRRHEKMHTSEKSFVCIHEGCGRAFFSRSDLNTHMLCHTKERIHACRVCGRKFGRLPDLKAHEKRHESKTHKHECPHCIRPFFRISDLRVHMQMCAGAIGNNSNNSNNNINNNSENSDNNHHHNYNNSNHNNDSTALLLPQPPCPDGSDETLTAAMTTLLMSQQHTGGGGGCCGFQQPQQPPQQAQPMPLLSSACASASLTATTTTTTTTQQQLNTSLYNMDMPTFGALARSLASATTDTQQPTQHPLDSNDIIEETHCGCPGFQDESSSMTLPSPPLSVPAPPVTPPSSQFTSQEYSHATSLSSPAKSCPSSNSQDIAAVVVDASSFPSPGASVISDIGVDDTSVGSSSSLCPKQQQQQQQQQQMQSIEEQHMQPMQSSVITDTTINPLSSCPNAAVASGGVGVGDVVGASGGTCPNASVGEGVGSSACPSAGANSASTYSSFPLHTQPTQHHHHQQLHHHQQHYSLMDTALAYQMIDTSTTTPTHSHSLQSLHPSITSLPLHQNQQALPGIMEHRHGAGCGHRVVVHNGHLDFLDQDGNLYHRNHDGDVEMHLLQNQLSGQDPALDELLCHGNYCKIDGAHVHHSDHVHGAGCGHAAIRHMDHFDYLVNGQLHNYNNGYCEFHGLVDVFPNLSGTSSSLDDLLKFI